MTDHEWVVSENQFLPNLIAAINEASDINSALLIALLQVCKVTDCDYGEVWFPCQNTMILEISPIYYINTLRDSITITTLEQFRLCSEALIIPPATGLPGRVWSSQQPEWIVDVSAQSETYFLRNQIAKACGVKAAFGVPILASYRVLAVLVFFMTAACQEDKRVITLVTEVATELAGVIQRLTPMAVK